MSSSRSDRLRRTAGIAVTVLLLGGAVAFFVGTPRNTSSGAGPVDGSPGSTGSSSARVVPSDRTAGASARPSAPSSVPSAGPAGTGPGSTEPGVEMVASPQTDGSWDVVERVQLATPDDTLTLVQPQISGLGGDFAGHVARIEDLQASADGGIAGLTRQGDRWRVSASSPGQVYVLRYVLSGATVRSLPSTAGRALTVLAPISRPGSGADQVRVVTTDAGVHSLQCPLLSGDAALCEASVAGARRSTRSLPRADALVLVQYDLPAPQ